MVQPSKSQSGEGKMGKIPEKLREIIASNIKQCRKVKFPGRGGGKACAEAFGVSPQQWSPWENGKRTPDELRLTQLAVFFGVTVEYLRHDHQSRSQTPPESLSTANLAVSGECQSRPGGSLSPFPYPCAKTPPFSCPPCCPLLATWTTVDQRRLLGLMEKYVADTGGDSRIA
jgi:transcriptional regulator with XRE-family HTH domain